MDSKLNIFVSYCFDDRRPPGEDMSDAEVGEWFVRLMKKRPLGYQVSSGRQYAEPASIGDKVKALIAESHCLAAVFTKRVQDSASGHWLPSQFVLCEAACAAGMFHDTGGIVCGFFEEGIDPHDLALVTIGGLELIPFRRSELESQKIVFIDYLKRIPGVLASGVPKPGVFTELVPPYEQKSLKKIYTIYSSGNVTVQNIVKIVIRNGDDFMNTPDAIIHDIWLPGRHIPPLSNMLDTPIDKRRDTPFLRGLLRKINNNRLNLPLDMNPAQEAGTHSFFKVRFLNKDGALLKVKNHDIILYQYAWGMPQAYARMSEDLAPTQLEPSLDAYNAAEVVANHGIIRKLIMELRFERKQGNLFSKSPFYRTQPLYPSISSFGQPHVLESVEDEASEDHEMWFETYRVEHKDFQRRLQVLWRPASSN
jgi:hypothetical protein